MQAATIAYKKSQINYLRVGNGFRLVFCLHGFGETAASFSALEGHTTNYTFIAIELPFHGQPGWNEGITVNPADIYEIMKTIACKESFTEGAKYTLLGYSLGGRIALSLYENYCTKIDRLVLVAPDGVIVNHWYYLATQTFLGNRVFGFIMKHPRWFLKIVKAMEKLNLVNAGVAKFVRLYLHDEKVRKQVYTVWTGYKNFRPDTKKISDLINTNHTPLRLLYGKFDKVISYKTGKHFIKNLGTNAAITIVETGHILITKKNTPVIMQLLKN